MADNDLVIQAPLNKERKDKFTAILTIPNILKVLNNRTKRENQYINLDSIQFSLYDFEIPSITVPEHNLQYAGQNYNVTSYNRPPYAPCTINFAVDNEFKNYWILWKWLELLNDPLKSIYASDKVFPEGRPQLDPPIQYDYQTDIIVLAMDEYNNNKAKFEFKYSFINSLGGLSYNYRDSGEMNCFFTFVFNQMDVILI